MIVDIFKFFILWSWEQAMCRTTRNLLFFRLRLTSNLWSSWESVLLCRSGNCSRLEKILLQPDIRRVVFNLKTLHFWSTDSNYPRLLGRAFRQKKFTMNTAEKRESWTVLTKLPIHISSPTKRFNGPISKQASYSLLYVCRLDCPRSRERPPGRKGTSCSVKNRIWTQTNLVDRGEMPNGASR